MALAVIAAQLCIDQLISHEVWKEEDGVFVLAAMWTSDVGVDCSGELSQSFCW